MSWNVGTQKVSKIEDFNAKLSSIQNDFPEEEARILLAQFLLHNIGFTFNFISGVQLLPIQEIVLRGLFLRDNALIVAGRGLGKSFIISVFCCLYPIFFPNTKICLISVNFRGSRRIFENSEKMVNHKKADLLRACFDSQPARRNDLIQWKMSNGSEIFALPLSNGEGLRGTRASVVLVDEGLLISREVQESIIRPFLSARQNFQEEADIRNVENSLISRGAMKEEDRLIFPSNKYLIFSSASYQFQYLYEIYNEYVNNTIAQSMSKNVAEQVPSYFVMRASYEAMPGESFLDMNAIEAAKKSGGENSEYFKREYRALFSAGNDGYFNVKKLYNCLIPDGQNPTIQLKGDPEAQYILAIDPSYSKAMNSDHFAMAVYMIIPEKREIMLVNSYGMAGTDLQDHYQYLTYLLKNFNIVYTIIDSSGTEFIDSYNSSVISQNNNIKLSLFDDINFERDDYMKEIARAKRQYNLTTRKFVYPQIFSGDNNRRMNEYLQSRIDASKVWFASRICNNENAYLENQNFVLPFKMKTKNGIPMSTDEFMEEQDMWIQQTINELALIEVRSTINGTLQYDLPSSVKKNKGDDKARRDNYTCCLLANYASKHYFDLMFSDAAPADNGFIPFMV